jgi:hypothetical protein
VNKVQNLAVEAGHTITFDWTGPEGNIKDDWSNDTHTAAVHSQREVAAAKCELFILVTPRALGGVGCFIEFGVALGNGALCYVFPFLDRDSVFFYHPSVYIIPNLDKLTGALKLAPGRYHGMRK